MISTQEKQRLCQQCKHRRNYFCKRHGDEWRQIVKERSFCEGWGNVQSIPMPRPSKLAVMVPIFDPIGSKVLWQNYRKFRESLPSDITVFVAEASYTGKFKEPSAAIKIHANEKQMLWQKERLLNLLLEKVPREFDAVAWIDADLIFENPNWFKDTLDQLAKHHVVQIYERADYIGADRQVERSLPSYGKSLELGQKSYFPGGAWAARRSAINGGLHEESIVGGGDKVQLRQWIKQGLSIGYTPGVVRHLYHGDYSHRQHNSRQEVLKRHQFDSNRDIKIDLNGLWSWRSNKPALHREVRKFFEKRSQAKTAPIPVKTTGKYDIDVFMPYHRNLHLVPQAIDAVLWQYGVRPFIHLVNDCSDEDDTALKQRYGHLDNVAWYQTKKNCGPYAIANSLYHRMQTEFIGIADSDDVLLPHHFETALKDLQEHNADAWGSSMSSVLNPLEDHSEHAVETLNRHRVVDSGRNIGLPYPRLVNGTMVIRKQTFAELNGFNGNWHCGADAEFAQRLQFPSDVNAKVFFSDQVTALRRICSNSLTNSTGKYGKNSPYRIQVRAERDERIKLWKNQGHIEPRKFGTLDSQEDVLIEGVQFKKPVKKESSDTPADHVRDVRQAKRVTACLASIPSREKALEKTVVSLISQVDSLKIHLNGYASIPSFLNHPKIEVVQGDNLRGGNAKFHFIDTLQGYIFICDDDLLYPPNYVEEMQRGIDTYRCLVGASGNSIKDPPPLKSYLKGLRNHPLQREVPEDTDTDLIGTGTLGWHTEDLRFKSSDIIYRNMVDISLLRVALRDRLPRKIIRHPDKWITRTTDDHGLHELNLADDSMSTKTINEVLATYPERTYSGKRITVSLINYKRTKNTHRIIDCLRKQTVPPVIYVWNNGEEPFENPHADLVINSNQNTHAHCSRFLCQYTDTEFVCRMDDDLMLADDRVLEDVINYMESHGKSSRIVGGYGVVLQDGKRYENSKHVGCGKLYQPITSDTPVDIIKGRIMFMRQEYAELIPLDTSHVHIDLTTSFNMSGSKRLFHIVPAFLDNRIIELPDVYDDGSGRGYSFMEGHLNLRNKLTEEWLCSLQ